MQRVHFTPIVWSIIVAVLLVFTLAIVLLIAMVIGQGDDVIEDTPQDADVATTDCTYTALAAQLMVYQAPVAVPSQQKVSVLGSENYPVMSQRDAMYEIELAEEDTGWSLGPEGTLQGDCEEIPQNDTPLSDFPTVCAIRIEQSQPLYSELELVNEVQPLEPGTYVVDAINNDRYLLLLNDGIAGWVANTGGQLLGACDLLVNPAQ